MRLLIPLLALACMDSDKFTDEHGTAYCTLLADCESLDSYGYSSKGECENGQSPLPEGCEKIDQKQSHDCLDAIETMTCEDLLAEAYPETCSSLCVDE